MKEALKIIISLNENKDAVKKIQSIVPDAEVVFVPWIRGVDADPDLDPLLIKDADILLCECPPRNFDDFKSLKWVQVTSAGYAQLYGLDLVKKGIQGSNALGNFDIPIAEWCMMMMLVWHRNLLELLDHQKNGIWDRDARFQRELRGSRLGIFGYGGIGRATARLAKMMGIEVHVLTRDGAVKNRKDTYVVPGTGDPEGILPDKIFALDQMETFVSDLDYFLLGLPLTPSTEGIIGEKELKMLKGDSVILNPARAKLIQEKALIRCMRESWVRGLSLDTHYAYPLPKSHPLWSMENVILSPHISGSCASTHFENRVYDIFCQNLERFIRGTPLINALTERQLNET